MVNKKLSKSKKNGVFYTPSILARTLVEPLIESSNLKIFDPSYGDGSLILAAEVLQKEKFKTKKKSNLFGCDISPSNKRTKHLLKSNFDQCDFFDYSIKKKYDLIIMNPPYVRHHYLDKEQVKKYKRITEKIIALKNTSDLWAYFLVKSILHLKKGGNVGAILPWSFLQADFSRDLRNWLVNNFSEIKIRAFGSDLFEEAGERIILLWMKGFSNKNRNIQLGYSSNTDELVKYQRVNKEQFTRSKVNLTSQGDGYELIEEYKNAYGFNELNEYANVSIGVVTGADEFFIKDNEQALDLGFESKMLIPIFNNSAQLRGFSINGNLPNQSLLCLTETDYGKYKDYLQYGIKKDFNLRSHSKRRNPWYSVNIGKTPDAFFPYRVSYIPYLSRNNKYCQSTNSIHRIYFKGLKIIEQKWIQMSLLSVPGQLSIEVHSKTYGNGFLKLEPGSLKRVIAYKSKNRSVGKVYNGTSRLLQLGKKEEAMKLATTFINEALGVRKKTAALTVKLYNEIKSRRIKR